MSGVLSWAGANWSSTIGAAVVLGSAAVLSAGLILALLPYLTRHALSQPNARSLHRVPTPQGGGLAVVVATMCGAGLGLVVFPTLANTPSLQILSVSSATGIIACVGVLADRNVLGAGPRLAAQTAAVWLLVAAFPDLRIFPELPWFVERAGLLIAGVWFINLANFMDGIDWMTVAEVVPVTAGVILIGALGGLSPFTLVLALALNGAMLGFAPFNRPSARLFLGDVGSLPIGLLTAFMLFQLAGKGHLAAALLLPLYYLADATITLLGRLIRGENLLEAHRSHFYQRAVTAGMAPLAVVTRVFAVNVALIALALVTVLFPSTALNIGALAIGSAVVLWLLLTFQRVGEGAYPR